MVIVIGEKWSFYSLNFETERPISWGIVKWLPFLARRSGLVSVIGWVHGKRRVSWTENRTEAKFLITTHGEWGAGKPRNCRQAGSGDWHIGSPSVSRAHIAKVHCIGLQEIWGVQGILQIAQRPFADMKGHKKKYDIRVVDFHVRYTKFLPGKDIDSRPLL